MDFRNEGLNMLKMQEVLDASEFFDSSEIVIPKPFMPLSSRSDTEPHAACTPALVHRLRNSRPGSMAQCLPNMLWSCALWRMFSCAVVAIVTSGVLELLGWWLREEGELRR